MEKKIQAALDAWVREYQLRNKKSPTWGELVAAGNEIRKKFSS